MLPTYFKVQKSRTNTYGHYMISSSSKILTTILLNLVYFACLSYQMFSLYLKCKYQISASQVISTHSWNSVVVILQLVGNIST